ncbi:hypothetical protein E3T55_14965 [Cryobacterium frigoriphilum]|uniref:Uncharacterized protein n=1 Tax=Cryobacterium frigoriphilum TaxID=1259150 RepID=A0A4R8ZW81_9MICO|nr:hypothetical protein [Cryobacterium frigoriphilum]TFD47848.1 hypothetical protein E3T55_14965 [Cryobacterium frigoriphilum]
MAEMNHTPDRRPRRQLSDSFYLVLAAMSLMQVPGGIEATGPWPAALIGVVTVTFAVLIALGNRGRFLPMFDNRRKR